ncbi:MAG: excinuclease ABC subunit UvrA [Bacteroidales bacterium]|nr:excinuclease ABC subunit UvrA [Bacteroidales bacterium]
MEDQQIVIKGASVHNLKKIDVAIDRNSFVVVTGVSGSGKSSLAFDTLYAEGQRRYVESLSSYARQFLGKVQKPEVESISGLPPAIAIEQKVNAVNPRSTVGTSTEIYDYIKLLFARIGKTISPVSGCEVKRHSVQDVVDAVLAKPGCRCYVSTPLILGPLSLQQKLEVLEKEGFNRLFIDGKLVRIADFDGKDSENVSLFVDRFVAEESQRGRIADSVQTAFREGNGACELWVEEDGALQKYDFSNRFEADGMQFEEPSVFMFNFNSPLGACPTCEGFGKVMGIDPNKVIPNKSLSVYENAVACWSGDKMSEWKNRLVMTASKFGFPIHRPYAELTEEQKRVLWEGNHYFGGINDFFDMVEQNLYKIQYRVLLARYRGKTACPECHGSRLKKEASYVKVAGLSILDIVNKSISWLRTFFDSIELTEYEQNVAERLLIEIKTRLRFLDEVGLGYLTLNRLSNTLSGGESQRINLATSLGSNLMGSLYVLDEPSIGLHSRDTEKLINVLKQLQQLGNTVVVVEHDEEIMRAADSIIDIGPNAGTLGGEVVFQGTMKELLDHGKSLTADYLSGKKKIEVPLIRRPWKQCITISGARENNLKNVTVEIPLGVFTVVTGVSGSGKSSLIDKLLYPGILHALGEGGGETMGECDGISGTQFIKAVEFVDQNPIGKSTRSNPVTYCKAFDDIRKLYSEQKGAQLQGFKPAHFSFNTEGGRCEECKGDGIIKVEMQFMADVELVCEECKGRRYKNEVLEILYRGKSIADILDMTVDEAITFFKEDKTSISQSIAKKLQPLQDVGLGYVSLGQPSSTFSGGELQRVKLATFLGKESKDKCLFIFDEPTTGLHFNDIKKLMDSFNRLIACGHSVVVIEHNLDVIKCADWIIDMGPEGGDAGGNVVFAGKPEELLSCKQSYTARYLQPYLKK